MDPAGFRLVAPEKIAPCAASLRGLRIPRRTLLGMMAGSLLTRPLVSYAQEVKEAKIGLLTERALPASYIDALRRGLAEFGWIEGRTFRIEQRSAEGDLDRLPALAGE